MAGRLTTIERTNVVRNIMLKERVMGRKPIPMRSALLKKRKKLSMKMSMIRKSIGMSQMYAMKSTMMKK